MSKKLIIGMLVVISGIITFIGITFMTLALTGNVSFLKNSITITSESYEKEYDGLGLDTNRYEVKGKLYDGDTVSIEFYDSSFNVGSYTAYFEAKVINKNGKDVSESYDINKNFGTVTIAKRKLKLKVQSAEEEYNGLELKAKEYEISEGTLATGDELDVTLTGSITEIGEAKASLIYTVYSLRNGNKVNVSSNYDVETENGILTKSAIPLTIKSDGAVYEYDGKYHSVDTYTTPYLKTDENDLDSTHTENLATGDTIDFNSLVNVKNVGTFSNDFEVSILDSLGNDVTKNYAIEKVYGDISILRKEITITSETKEREYNDETYVAQTDSSYQIDGSFAEGDYPKVTFTQVATTAGTYDNTFYTTIYNQDGDVVSNNYLINHVYGKIIINQRPLTVITKSYEKVYDGEVLKNIEDLTISAQTPLLPGHTLIATFTDGIVSVGETINHATITIKNADSNDVTRNYSILLDAGTLTVKKRELVIRASSYQKAYDGNPIVSNSWNLVSGTMAPNEYLNVTVKPEYELIDVGSVRNIISYQIVNASGQILTNALSNYDIKALDGILTIYEAQNKPLYLAPKDVYKQYVDENTTAQATEILGFDYYQSLGYSIEYVIDGTQVGLGSSISSIKEGSIRIKDGSGVDVTNQFVLHLFTGLLQVYEKEITIVTDSIEEEYNGQEHTANGCTITGNDGLEVIYNVIGSQKNVGTSMNQIQISGVYLDTDTEHTNNLLEHYYIHINLGTIKVTPKSVTVNTQSMTQSITDGPLSVPLEESDITGLISSHTFLQSECVLDYVGTKQNTITIIILDELGQDITSNYNITYNYGKLTLTN